MEDMRKLAVYAGMYQRSLKEGTEVVRMYATDIAEIRNELLSTLIKEEDSPVPYVSEVLHIFEGVNQCGQHEFSSPRYLEVRHHCTGDKPWKGIGDAHRAHVRVVKYLRRQVEKFNTGVEARSSTAKYPLRRAELIADGKALGKLLQFRQMAMVANDASG